MIALDASALMAFLFRETGHELVATELSSACISTVNLAEVLGRFTRDGHDAAAVIRKLAATSIEFVPFSSEQATLAAILLPTTRPLGLSLGDRACLALAITRNIPVWTADQSWHQLALKITVRVIR